METPKVFRCYSLNKLYTFATMKNMFCIESCKSYYEKKLSVFKFVIHVRSMFFEK